MCRLVRERVALENRHLGEVRRKRGCRAEPTHACSDDDRVITVVVV
jgi:hypothetical protein